MACHAPTEEVDDNEREFLAAAVEDDTLVAKLLMRLSRSEAHIVWRQLPGISKPPPPPPPGAKDGILASPPPTRARLRQAGTWGRRRTRSIMAFSTDRGSAGSKRESERRSSPATPLSWSGASGTSGSAGEEGWSTPSRPPKRRKGRWVQEYGESSPPLAPDPRTEVYRRGVQIQVPASLEVGAPAVAIGTPAGSGSAKAAAAEARVRAPPKAAAHAAPLRLGSRGDGANWAVMRRQGKKKTVPELRAMTESLLREQQELQKELGKQKEVYDALLGENMALKKLESNLSSLTTGKPTVAVESGEAKPEEPPHIHSISGRQALIELGTATVAHAEGNLERTQCRRSTSCVPGFLFDLNCLPDGNL